MATTLDRSETKILLSQDEVPRRWYNLLADVTEPPAPPLNPETKEPIFVIAKGHNRIDRSEAFNCPHERLLRARNVEAGMRGSKGTTLRMVKVDDRNPARKLRSVTFCQRCDVVMDFEEDTRGA